MKLINFRGDLTDVLAKNIPQVWLLSCMAIKYTDDIGIGGYKVNCDTLCQRKNREQKTSCSCICSNYVDVTLQTEGPDNVTRIRYI